jgi:hypothetical protein
MRAALVIALLSLLASTSSVGEARLIGLGGGALIDVTGALGLSLPIVPMARLSVELFVLGVDLDLWFLPSSIQFVPALAVRLQASLLTVIEFYAAIAPVSFQFSLVTQMIPRTTIRWGANLGFGLVSLFSELTLVAQWGVPIVWQGPGVGLGVQVGF